MSAIFGRGVSAVMQVQSDFAVFPSTGTWYPTTAYERSDGETRPREVDPALGVPGMHNNRDPVTSSPTLTQGGGQVQVPICLREIGLWLIATFGAPVTEEVETGVYKHTFESGKDVLAYLAQSKKFADGWYERSRGLCVNTFAVNLAKESGFPRATLGLMLRDAIKAETQASGVIADAFTPLRPAAAKPFVSRGDEDVATPTTAFAFNYSNQFERFDQLKPEGDESEYPEGFDPGDSLPSGNFTVRLQDATFDDLADADTAEPWKFGWRVADALGDDDVDAVLRFTAHNVKIDRAAKSVSDPGRLTQTYNYQVEQNDDGPAITIELINDVPYYIQTVPAAFASDDWSVAPGDEQAAVTITDLPANGNSTITDIEYRVDAGAWVSSGGIVSFAITGLTNAIEYDIALRAVNAVGAGAASAVKAVTPAP